MFASCSGVCRLLVIPVYMSGRLKSPLGVFFVICIVL